VVDVSRAEREARRARRSQEFIVDVSAQLAQSLDFVGTAERLTRTVIPELADYAVLFLEEDGEVRRAAGAHIDPTLVEEVRAGPALPLPADSPLVASVRAGNPLLLPEVDQAWLDEHSVSSGHRERLERLAPRSILVVPLVARGRTLGALVLSYSISERRYSEQDVPTALNLASRGALALDNARLFQELGDEMRLVETLNAFGRRVTAEHDLEAVLALAAEEATAQVGAELGVFAYRPPDEQAEGMAHVATAAAPPEMVASLLALPRGERVARISDLHDDPRGMGLDAAVRSYLAVPVDLPDGEFLGTLVLGHGRSGAFLPRHERVLQGLARWAAVAVQNARLLRQAQLAAAARDGMLAVVSHDLRNPLNVIATSASLILEIPLPEEKKRTQLEVIRRTTDRMNRLIQDLLDVTGIEAGKLSINPEALDVDHTLTEACEMMAPLVAERRLELVCEQLASSQTIRADRERLLQVFSNLLGNAIRFTPEGGTVTVGAEQGEGEVIFFVQDTGPGIPCEDLPRLFDRFWKGTNSPGTGLGLPIAKGIVEVHGGTITVDSEPGRGTRVRFSIPFGGPAPTPQPPSPSSSSSRRASSSDFRSIQSAQRA
jgi:signal transduction histidine kinase